MTSAASSAGPAPCILATGGYDHSIKLWDVLTGNCVSSLHHPNSQVNALAVSSKASGRQYMVAAGNPGIRLYDLKSGNQNALMTFEGHTGNVTAVGFESSSEARWIYSASEDGTLRIWDLRADPKKGQHRLYEPKPSMLTSAQLGGGGVASVAASPINAAVLHPNEAEIMTGDQNGALCVWDLTSSSAVASATYVPEQDVPIRSISVTRDGARVAAVSSRGALHSWTSKSSRTFGASPLGDDKDTRPVHEIIHDTYILKCCWSPDMKLFATASADHTVKIWDADFKPDMKPLKIFNRHQRWVWDCAFTSDSSYLLSASSDHSARLWSLASLTAGVPQMGPSGDMVRIFVGHSKAVTCIALSDEPE